MIESDSGETFAPKWFDRDGRMEFTLQVRDTDRFFLRTSAADSMVLVGSAGQLIADAADREPENQAGEREFAYQATSEDQRVKASAWTDPGGVIIIHVETREPALRGARAFIEFWSPDSHKLLQETLDLDLEKWDNEGNIIYWGAWFQKVSLPVDADMRVVAFPRRFEGPKGPAGGR